MSLKKYTLSHQWILVEDSTSSLCQVGITDYAQAQLGDIVSIELPTIGTTLKAGDLIGVIESVKSASEYYSPASLQVTEINQTLQSSPEEVNESAETIWFFKADLTDNNLDDLLSEANYLKHVEGL